MSAVVKLKKSLLGQFSNYLSTRVPNAVSAVDDPRAKAKLVNALVAEARAELANKLTGSGGLSKQDELIVLQYCTTVSNLEFRNQVWPYEYMALSRRMGELWERFCKTAWEAPKRANVARTDPPDFGDVLRQIHRRVEPVIPQAIKGDFENLIGLIDPINMIEDEVFLLDGKLHVIDFKSGFGSNEKGNMLRLLAVGRAYKLYQPDTELLFLVRQDQNNNYLKKIQASGLWHVHSGNAAYKKIDELTGSDIHDIRKELIDFDSDLSANFWNTLGSARAEVVKYFLW